MTTTIPSAEPKEIEHFNKLADTWWDPKGPFWPLHKLNIMRVDWIVQQLRASSLASDSDKPLLGMSMLDVGCGGGILSEFLARFGAEVTGIDIVEKNIAVARSHALQQRLAKHRLQCSIQNSRTHQVSRCPHRANDCALLGQFALTH